jgi:phosphoribosylaminoimidazolecarboxamide formyltransferase/IMP cyclohydrolase
LKGKKGGKFIVLQADPSFQPGTLEYREVFGCVFSQKRNDVLVTKEHFQEVVTLKKDLTDNAVRDLILASICIKYTQSNSVGFSKNGMMVGVGAGQQSRVDCVKLAGSKVATWYLRQHPKVLGLPFKDSVKKQDRVNARVRYIEGDFTVQELEVWKEQFTKVPEPLTTAEKNDFLSTGTGVALSSDAFFPFRDSIDHASKYGVSFVAQPGGSVQDNNVAKTCDEYGMTMAITNIRLFHH